MSSVRAVGFCLSGVVLVECLLCSYAAVSDVPNKVNFMWSNEAGLYRKM